MAKKKPEDPPKGSPAWMATFSDLMNLLLCFFVLLFSMSTVDAAKFQELVASLHSTTSILPKGGATIGDGEMISAGVRQLEFLDAYYNDMANSKAEEDTDDDQNKGTEQTEEDIRAAYEEQALSESEKMAEQIEEALQRVGLQDVVDVSFNAEYVRLSMSGAILFESGKSELISDAKPVIDKISRILTRYNKSLIDVEGHTDNVPISSSRYESNNVLSMYRALTVADYIRSKTEGKLDPGNIVSSGRGDYNPVADNSTAEGRARNRRVEIKIYNSFNSNVGN